MLRYLDEGYNLSGAGFSTVMQIKLEFSPHLLFQNVTLFLSVYAKCYSVIL